jgi:hypothetical protein
MGLRVIAGLRVLRVIQELKGLLEPRVFRVKEELKA